MFFGWTAAPQLVSESSEVLLEASIVFVGVLLMTDYSKHSTMEKCAFILMVIVVTTRNADASYMATCEADHQCPPGYYCYLETKYCAPCTDCRAMHRRNSTRIRCTKGYSQCGPCLDGFQEEILTSGKPRDLCVPLDKVEEGKKDENIFIIGTMFMVIIVMIIFVAAGSFIHIRKMFEANRRMDDVGEDPPPYSSLAPVTENSDNIGVERRLVDQEEGGIRERLVDERDRDVEAASTCGARSAINERSHSCSWIERKAENLQQAVPFCLPTYAVNQNFSDQDDSGISEVDNGSGEISPSWQQVDLHDETTMPSDWTPMTTMISVSENREMEMDEGACTEATCEREGDELNMTSQVSQTSELMQQRSNLQQMLASAKSSQPECN